MASATQKLPTDDAIQVHYGSLALQFGIGTIPKIFLRFYRHLVHTPSEGDPLRLSDAEAMMLVHVMALRSEEDFVLRLSNLPMAAPEDSRTRCLTKLRKMGVVFTSRLYYTRTEMIQYYGPDNLPETPRLKAQQWDLSSLVFNLSQVAQEYLRRQRAAIAKWREDGETGSKPVTELPGDYQSEIILPPDVVAKIQYGLDHPDKAVYYPVPEEWKRKLSAPSDFRVAQDAPGQLEAYQENFAWLDVIVGTPAGVGRPTSGPLTPNPAKSERDRAASAPRNGDGNGKGNDDLNQDKSLARAPDQTSGDEPPAGGNEPIPVWRERVLRDLREHDKRRTQIYIVAINVGLLMGLRWMDGQLRTRPIREDKAEIGKMCREHGGPAHVWTVACRAAGHEISGDPLDYLWGCLKAESEGRQGQAATAAQVFENVDYSKYRYMGEK